jgi:hypothetical protein
MAMTPNPEPGRYPDRFCVDRDDVARDGADHDVTQFGEC